MASRAREAIASWVVCHVVRSLWQFVPCGWRRDGGQRVDDAVSVEPVEVQVPLAQRIELRGPAHVGVAEQRRVRARVFGRRTEEQALDLRRLQSQARMR